MGVEFHQNDTTQFVVTINNDVGPVDISNASITQLVFQRPGTGYNKLTVNASFYTNGVDGKLSYVTSSGDLDTVGTWKLQGYVQIGPSGWRSDIHSFKVNRNL